MANALRKKTPAVPSADELSPEKEVDVTVKEVVKDERTTKILGAIALLFAFFLLIAFTSYLFTWQEDQDKVQEFGIKIFSTADVKPHNLLGGIGAYTAHWFMFNGFGIASFLFCTTFFVLGINLLVNKKVFNLFRNLKYVTVGLLVISVALSFITANTAFSWGGAVGELVNDWLVKWIGTVGTGATLLVLVFIYVIWRFNPTFKWPEKIAADNTLNDTHLQENEYVTSTTPLAATSFQALHSQPTVPTDATLEEEPIETPNKLKSNSASVTVIPPAEKEQAPDPMSQFEVVEKQPERNTPTINDLYAANKAGWQLNEGLTDIDMVDDDSEEEQADLDDLDEADIPFTITDNAPSAPAPDSFIPVPTTSSVPLSIASSGQSATTQASPHMPIFEIKPSVEEEINPILSRNQEGTLFIQDNDATLQLEDAAITEEDTEAEKVSIIEAQQHTNINYDPILDLRDYRYPTLDLLEQHGSEKIVHDAAELEQHKNQIIETLRNYDIAIQRIAATVGPTVTLYEIVPAPGVRISRIKNLEDDIALSLAALGIRIIAPIPGKGTIGIEVPNVRKSIVSMRTLLSSEKFQNTNFSLPIAIGKKIDNENFIVDLAAMPHLLMAGATGQGKSVGINTLLVSLLYKKHPAQLKFVLVDPKKVELSLYKTIEKHFLAKLPGEEESIITDTKKVVHTLNALCIEMDNRYDLLKEAGCRNIKEYNEKFTHRKLNPQKGHQYLPFIVLVVDEFADLIMTAGKEVEQPIARLAQLARAIGIHLIIATQRPSVNIITGTIKANFPARIAFKVSSKIDSRTILDAGGAEQLIGKGDMLISYNGEIVRLQCAFVDTPEVEKVCEFIGDQRGYPDAFLLPEYVDENDKDAKGDFDSSDRDPLFADAARLIVQNQIGSTSLIQRRMKLGYNRAGRLMDQLERAGIVGPNAGSKAREVRFQSEMELEEFLDSLS